MKKDMKKDERRRQNNKGFSLVELIVVIAIMAVLVAVLAPQFTKYVDRSRQSVDATTVAGIVSAAQVGAADVIDYSVPDGDYTITVSETAGTTIKKGEEEISPSDTAPNLANAIKDACGDLGTLKTTAKEWGTEGIVITIKVHGNVTVEYKDGSKFKAYIDKAGTAVTTPSVDDET